MYVEARRTDEALELALTGDWRARNLPAIAAELAAIGLGGVRRIDVAIATLASLDLSASWQLRDYLAAAERAGIEVAFRDGRPDPLRVIDETLGREAYVPPDEETQQFYRVPLDTVGRRTVHSGRALYRSIAFFGRVSVMVAGALRSVRRLRPISIARHVYDTGITAVPIVSLIAFLISVIIAYMGAQQLISFGAEIFVVDLVTIGVLRELGVLLTAIIVAGRSGSAFAAEIGAMRLNEEVDALHATGVDPIEVLVLPRILGLVIALPLLTFVADLVGLTGGALLCRWLIDMPLTQYVARVNEAISPTTFWVGIAKAPVFAVLIAMAGTYRGMQVRGSSRELGRLTTVAVVQSIFLVILADALFAVMFMELDI